MEPGTDLDSTLPSGAPMPVWAIGAFGLHHTDIWNWLVTPQGEVLHVFLGGDYGGGCVRGTAGFADGRVLLSFGSTQSVLVRTTEGRFFLGSSRPDGGQLAGCAWHEVVHTALCGRDVGGCGGYGSAVACEWREAVGAACDSGHDGGVDGGAADAS